MMGGDVLKTIKKETLEKFPAICNEIAKYAGVKIEFTIVEIEAVDAFAKIEGGSKHVVFSFGMVDLVGNDPDMIAGLCGHEIAHHSLNHFEEKWVAASLLNTVTYVAGTALNVLTGVPSVALVPLYGVIGLAFSQKQEREADEWAVRYMMEAGYDAQGLVAVFESFEAASTRRRIPFLETHPSYSNRVEHIKTLASELSP